MQWHAMGCVCACVFRNLPEDAEPRLVDEVYLTVAVDGCRALPAQERLVRHAGDALGFGREQWVPQASNGRRHARRLDPARRQNIPRETQAFPKMPTRNETNETKRNEREHVVNGLDGVDAPVGHGPRPFAWAAARFVPRG